MLVKAKPHTQQSLTNFLFDISIPHLTTCSFYHRNGFIVHYSRIVRSARVSNITTKNDNLSNKKTTADINKLFGTANDLLNAHTSINAIFKSKNLILNAPLQQTTPLGWFTQSDFYSNSKTLLTRINIFMSWNNAREKIGSCEPAFKLNEYQNDNSIYNKNMINAPGKSPAVTMFFYQTVRKSPTLLIRLSYVTTQS